MTLVRVKTSNLRTITICQNPRLVESKIRVSTVSTRSHPGIYP